MQSRPIDRVVVVTRVDDTTTFEVTRLWSARLPLETVQVNIPGVIQAMNAGLEHCIGDIVAITDDDAAPRREWLAQIEARLAADSNLGGVGGRDWVYKNGQLEDGSCADVGRVSWYGRITGNHHLGSGPARKVEILKGVNCAFRMSALRPIGFDTQLQGGGAQVHWELCLCFAIKRAGWELLYDPAIAVDHFPAQRFDRDGRDKFDPVATADRAHNFRVAMGGISPGWKRLTALLWHHLIGTVDEPGLVRFFRMMLRREPYAFERFCSAHGFKIGSR